MSTWTIHTGKVEEVELPKEHFHAILCDPPYELGFMGRNWDKSGVAFNPATWARLAESLLPGGFGMAFASSRGWHRLACAIEDAGLIIHPSIFDWRSGREIEVPGMLGWGFGSGFPKATRIDTQVDAAAGVERGVVGEGAAFGRGSLRNRSRVELGYRPTELNPGGGRVLITAPATELAAAWEGHRYGLQAMKPAIEPIIVFQKPYRGKPVDCITATGAGALNIDAGRIGVEDVSYARNCSGDRGHAENRSRDMEFAMGCGSASDLGRWPANFCMDEEAARRIDEQTGELSSGMMAAGTQRQNLMGYSGTMPAVTHEDTYGDSGGASRFFHVHDWSHEVAEQLEAADPVGYFAKAGRGERDAGLSGPKRPMLWSSGTQNPGSFQAEGTDRSARNPHPTVKPIALTRWLASLLLPPDRYAPRRLLVSFAGSGSEMIGGLLAGWEEITGVEMGADHVAIAEARLKFWAARKHKPVKVAKAKEAPAGQMDLLAHG